ncbi:DUF5565 family protein [Vibrio harveyi]|uniref:RNA ligase 1 family protein n=1 Tax=Vibrio harveyi TaxID=669 RepID=UPI003CF6E443
MKKIKPLFIVDRDANLATEQVHPDAHWVIEGEGLATIKYDGTPALIKEGVLYKRWNRSLQKHNIREWRRSGKENVPPIEHFKSVPEGAIQLEAAPAPVTLHFPYWVPVGEDDQRFTEALNNAGSLPDGTYELVGPKVQNNKYSLGRHELWRHGSEVVEIPDLSYEGVRNFLASLNAEGIVWHRDNGDMIKIRRSHFDLEWKNRKGSVPIT